jgi:TMEM175 potassium channel family protein
MSDTEGAFSKSRLEAFSDGVIAVIITIMVLELKAPESAEVGDLLKLWPSFAIYLVSFVFVAVYWINHHSILTLATRITPGIIWANNILLFCLSLIPFATAYVANTNLGPLPTEVYGALQLACSAGFALTFNTIVDQRRDDSEFMRTLVARRRRKNWLSVGAYALAVVAATVNPLSALAIFVAVLVAYVVPGLFADRQREGRRS